MGLSLLCWVALCFWAAGKALFWNSCLPLQLAALPPGAALTGSLTSCFLTSICLLPPQAPRTQRSPRLPDVVRGKAQKAKMECVPVKGHSYVYWYQKKPEEELKFLVYLQNEQIIEKTEFINERVSVQCPKNSPCSMEIQSTEVGDSATYFCASSQSTVLNVSFP